jgi:hypothetical protein
MGRATGLGRAAVAIAVRRMYYALGYVVPLDAHDDDATGWAISNLGQSHLEHEPGALV